jgi:hypothetical protein
VLSRGEKRDFLVTMVSYGDKFIRFPSEELLELCTKEQLLKINEHDNVEISEKCHSIRLILKANLMECYS